MASGGERGRGLALLFLAVAAVVVVVWVVRRTTWYLAIDQFGYLTFARDLIHGRVLHPWPLLDGIVGMMPPAGVDVDVLAQTYVRNGTRVFSRYSPGFPLVLALVGRAFGEVAEHWVNAIALGALMGCLYALARRVLGSSWLGLAAALLAVLLPNYVVLWSISPLRDVPAHLFAFSGFCALIGAAGWRRPLVAYGLAGLLLGYAMSTRIDAVLYLSAAGGLMLLQWREMGRAAWSRGAVMATGLLLGLVPLLGYNWIATGNPFRPTQAMEARELVARVAEEPIAPARQGFRLPAIVAFAHAADDDGAPDADAGSGADRAEDAATPPAEGPGSGNPGKIAVAPLVQGGGLRLRNLPTILPENLALVREALGDLTVLCALVGAIAAVRAPTLFLLTVPYTVLSLLFFSLWLRADPRYLLGVLLLAPILALHGARCAVAGPRWVADRAGRGAAVALALGIAAVAVAVALRAWGDGGTALPWVMLALGSAIALGALASAVDGSTPARSWFPPLVGLLLFGVLAWRAALGIETRASFQEPQVEEARRTLAATLEPRAVVLTSDEIGRPAENINYYTDAEAVYFSELIRWRWFSWTKGVEEMSRAGFAVYLLLPPSEAEWRAGEAAAWFEADVVARIAPQDARRYFVAAPFHRGIPLSLIRLRPRPVVGAPGGAPTNP